MLAQRWHVPLHDLPPDALGAAIKARNGVVHRGHYYDDATSKAEKDLWTHIRVVREVVVRFVLTVLGYKGRYISFLGEGYRDVNFPPPPAGDAPTANLPT